MNQTIEPVTEIQQVLLVAALAKEIWNQHYVSIVGQEQVDYILEKSQSADAIQAQIASGYQYYLALIDDVPMGYLGLVPNEPNRKLMLSKIYVRDLARGTGIGTTLLAFTKKQASAIGAKAVWLTVNRNNQPSIAWYKRKGFMVTDEVKTDIGSGFYMDDYIMEWAVG